MSDDEPFMKDAHVTFPSGTLTLTELQQLFKTLLFELDLVDANDRFSWYSDQPNRNHVRSKDQLGKTLAEIHPAKILPAIKSLIESFKTGKRDSINIPSMQNGHKIMTTYYALRDDAGTYLGTLECTANVDQILAMSENGAFDAISGASSKPNKPAHPADATTGASAKPKMPENIDTTTSASQQPK